SRRPLRTPGVGRRPRLLPPRSAGAVVARHRGVPALRPGVDAGDPVRAPVARERLRAARRRAGAAALAGRDAEPDRPRLGPAPPRPAPSLAGVPARVRDGKRHARPAGLPRRAPPPGPPAQPAPAGA